MTMQTSGQISMGQAMAECGIGAQQFNAGSQALSKLAGVSPGQQYAWSFWYGKSNLPDIVNQQVATASCYVDRINEVSFNLRTGAVSLLTAQGDHGPHLSWSNVFPPAQIQAYASWTCSLQWLAGSHRMNVWVKQQPNPGNDFTVIVRWDDQGSDVAQGQLPGNIPQDGENQNGATDEAITILLTCTKP